MNQLLQPVYTVGRPDGWSWPAWWRYRVHQVCAEVILQRRLAAAQVAAAAPVGDPAVTSSAPHMGDLVPVRRRQRKRWHR